MAKLINPNKLAIWLQLTKDMTTMTEDKLEQLYDWLNLQKDEISTDTPMNAEQIGGYKKMVGKLINKMDNHEYSSMDEFTGYEGMETKGRSVELEEALSFHRHCLLLFVYLDSALILTPLLISSPPL